MLIPIICSSCKTEYEAEASGMVPGSTLTCPRCKAEITIPKPSIGPGVKLGGFSIIRKLGEGAMGQVYLAKQLSMDREVALKILPPQFTIIDDAVSRFQQEVRMAAKVEHPNLVTAYEAGEDDGVYYLAIRYVDGQSLDEQLEKEGACSEQESLTIVRKVADALRVAWNSQKLMHRDIKPANIMMGKDGEPQLTDLGMARSLNDSPQLTMTAMAMGTPNYMSPEQIESAADTDCRADIYSLGATLYSLVTGKVPFEGSTLGETLKKQLIEPLPDPRKTNPDLSDGCVDMIELMLAKDREERYQCYEDLIADIDLVLESGASSRGKLESGQSIMMRAEDIKRLTQMVHSGTTIGIPKDAGKNPESAVKKPSGRNNVILVVLAVIGVLAIGAGIFLNGSKKSEAKPSVQPAEQEPPEMPDKPQPIAGNEPENAIEAAEDHVKISTAESVKEKPPGRNVVDDDVEAGEGLIDLAEMPVEPKITIPAVPDLQEVIAPVLDAMLSGNIKDAQIALGQLKSSGNLHDQGEWAELQPSLERALQVEDVILDAYDGIKGKTTTVYFENGAKIIRIDGRRGQTVRAITQLIRDGRVVGSADASFDLSDLHVREKINRLGERQNAETDVMKGLMACQVSVEPHGLNFFKRADSPVAKALIERHVKRSEDAARAEAARADAQAAKVNEQREARAATLYDELLSALDVSELTNDRTALVDKLSTTLYSKEQLDASREKYAVLETQGTDTSVYTENLFILKVISRLNPRYPLLINQEMLDRAIESLKQAYGAELNIHRAEIINGGVALDLSNNKVVRDLSPLKGLPIQRLNLTSTSISDLSPLRGMPLEELQVGGCRDIDDLGPLQGLPIKDLNVDNTSVSDFTPLIGMPLVALSAVKLPRPMDLKPLAGLPLEMLVLSDTSARSFAPLKEMSLTGAYLANTGLEDLSLLKHMNLTHLAVSHNPIKSLDALKGKKLMYLNIAKLPVDDLEPLRGMPLKTVVLNACQNIRDYSPLYESPVAILMLDKNGLEDLRFLQNWPDLKRLGLSDNPGITSLEPLKSLSLQFIALGGAKRLDLTPLSGMSELEEVDLHEAEWIDLAPLVRCPLTKIVLTGSRNIDMTPLTNLPALKPGKIVK